MSTTKDHHNNKAKALPETGSENNGSNNERYLVDYLQH